MRLKKKEIKTEEREKKETLFDIHWQNRYAELIDFKKEYGHCIVPQHYPKNRALGHWVIRQRVRKKYLSPERVELLNEISFIWNLFDYYWGKNYNKLKEFKRLHGHCYVSKGVAKNIPLAEWVIKQRKDKKQGKKRLGSEKIKKLEQLGFDWGTSRTPWETRYKELKEFKEKYGHCKVPGKWKENKPLANWVAIQRRDKEKLSKQEIEKLDKIGFLWGRKRKGRNK